MVIWLGGFGGLSEVHRCLSCFPAHLSICEESVRETLAGEGFTPASSRDKTQTPAEVLFKTQGRPGVKTTPWSLNITVTPSAEGHYDV